jgi:hypothetical protein
MHADDYKILTGEERPNLRDLADEIVLSSWPEFMFHDAMVDKYWSDNFRADPRFHFGLFENNSDKMIALANSIPLAWEGSLCHLPDSGLDWALERAFEDRKAGRVPTIQSALQIVIAHEFRGRGISSLIVQKMLAIGREHGLRHLVAPVRPTLKADYPLIPMRDYICWKDSNGLPFDPWMRVHSKLGARIVKVCPQSMLIEGSVSEWESWTGMKFPKTDRYVVPGALEPVDIDVHNDMGTYIEPNVWMCHDIPAS